MGGSQSSQEERVVNVEQEEEGGITVTQDFVSYLQKQSGSPPPYTEPPRDHVTLEDPYVSAEEVFGGREGGSVEEGQAGDWRQMKALAQLTDEEIENTVSQLQGQLVDGRLVGAPVCEGHKDSVLECYASHPKRPLECSSQVAAYLQCVERARKEQVSKSEANSE